MSMGEKVNKALGRIKSVIYGRTAAILLGFAAQLALLGVGYILLSNYSFWFYLLFLAVSAVAMVHIFNTPGNPDLKLSWMFPIAFFPVFGSIVYTIIVLQPGTKVLYARLTDMARNTKKYVIPRGEIRDRLRSESPHMGQLAHYLENCDNSPVYDSTQVKYYPLGDLQFADMVEELKKAEKYIFMEFFIVSGGALLGTVLDILKEKAKAGVEIRFMYDGTNVLWNLPGFFPQMLEDEGIRCKIFAPIKPIFSTHYNNRDHRKILVIDGKTAFIKSRFEQKEIPLPRNIRKWYTEHKRIKKETAIRICFAFGLTVEESEDFMRRICLLRGFDCHKVEEVICFYAISNRLDYAEAQKILERAPRPNTKRLDFGQEVLYTASIVAAVRRFRNPEELIRYISGNIEQFGYNNATAYRYIRMMWEEISGEEGLAAKEKKKLYRAFDDMDLEIKQARSGEPEARRRGRKRRSGDFTVTMSKDCTIRL